MGKALTGVNLGGWLVAEKWMTPSLFRGTAATNEYELLSTEQGRERLRTHHETFITGEDLKWMKDRGIEILRVPIGYWIFGDDRHYVGAIDRLDWLVTTSLFYGLKLLLDLHAAPGAQNRAAHSGSGNSDAEVNSTNWLNDIIAQQRTIDVLKKLALRYRDSPNIWGIEIVNEPAIDRFGLKLVSFYRRAYKELIKVARPGMRIVFSDGYAPLLTTNTFWLRKKRDFPVVMDCHIYQVFGNRNKNMTFNQHVDRAIHTKYLLWFLSLMQPVLVGEWSAMLPIKVADEETRLYVARQLQAFGSLEAHFYWSYKTEADGRWNYRDQIEKGLLQ